MKSFTYSEMIGFAIIVSIVGILVVSLSWISPDVPNLFKGSFTLIGAGLLALTTGAALLGISPRYHMHFIRIFVVSGAVLLCMLGTSLRGGFSYFEFTGFAIESWTFAALFASLLAGMAASVYVFRSGNILLCLRVLAYTAAFVNTALLSDVFFQHGYGTLFGDWFSTVLFAACGLILACGNLLSARGRGTYVDVLTIGVLSTALILSGDRSVLLTSSMAIGFLLLLNRDTTNIFWRSIGILSIVLVLIGIFLPTQFVPASVKKGAYTEIRPSYRTTQYVALMQFAREPNSFIVGSSHSNFETVFASYRPVSVNTSPLWDKDFPSGSSLMMTILIFHGALFVVIFMILITGVILEGVRVYRKKILPSESAGGICAIFFSTVWMWLYVPNTAFLIVVIFLVVLIWALVECAYKDERRYRFSGVGIFLCALVLIVSGIASIGVASVRLSALISYANGLQALGSADFEVMENLFSTSIAREPLPPVQRLYAASALGRIRRDIEKSGNVTEVERNEIIERLEAQISRAENAYESQENHFRGALTIAQSLYIQALLTGTSFEPAVAYVRSARVLAPLHPLPLLLEAQMSYSSGDSASAQERLRQAFALKPDFKEARELLDSIEAKGM